MDRDYRPVLTADRTAWEWETAPEAGFALRRYRQIFPDIELHVIQVGPRWIVAARPEQPAEPEPPPIEPGPEPEPVPPPLPDTETMSVFWEAPSERVDGSTMTHDEIDYYTLYWNQDGELGSVNTTGTEFELLLRAGKLTTVAVTCIDTGGQESEWSNRVTTQL